jgi:hypothetical protein
VPFTLSHAAAAWPFRRTRLEFSALLTGCFVPDFPYFLFLIAHGFDGHTIRGLFFLDLPVGLVALWLFHRWIRRPFSIFLPAGVRSRLKSDGHDFSFLPLPRLAMIVLSILIGGATHIAWDEFTHRTLWLYRHWAFLRIPYDYPLVGTQQMYKLLQYTSTFFGLGFVAFWIWHWYHRTSPVERPVEAPFTPGQRRALVVILPLVATCGGALRAYFAIEALTNIKSLVLFAGDALVTSISLFGLELLLCGFFLRWREAATRHA